MPMICEVSHGGSRRGNGKVTPWGWDCLYKLDLQQYDAPRHCAVSLDDQEHQPYFLIGTLFHAYMEYYAKHGNCEPLTFVDNVCPHNPGEDICAEAWRLFEALLPTLDTEELGTPVHTEELLDGPYMQEMFGIDITGRIDWIVERDDGLYIVDFKTCSRKKANKRFPNADYNHYVHKRGPMGGFFQRVVYTHGAIAKGIPVQGFEFWQIVRSQEPELIIHRAHWVSEREREIARLYFLECEERRLHGKRFPILSFCDTCEYNYNGQCDQGYEAIDEEGIENGRNTGESTTAGN